MSATAAPDYSRFTAPVWPKAHTLKLNESYPDSDPSTDDLWLSNHRAGRAARDGTGRRAGTHGQHDAEEKHDDGAQAQTAESLAADQSVLEYLSKQEFAQSWSTERKNEVERLLEQVSKIGQDPEGGEERKGGDLAHGGLTASEATDASRSKALEELFKSQDVVISIRELKHLVKNWKRLDPEIYGSTRAVLPATEDDIKKQDWQGRREEEESKKAKQQSGDEKQDDQKQGGDQKEGDDKDSDPSTKARDADSPGDNNKSNNQENGQDPSELDPEQHAYLTRLMQEMDMLTGMQNNPGKPANPLPAAGGASIRKEGDGDLMKGRLEHALAQRRHGDAMEIQQDDQFTPDSWIPRSSKLVRLTGKHPMNAEANMTELYDAGLITPTKFHYIRNHGAVPRLAWESHKLEVFSDPPGLVQSTTFSMDDIAAFEPVEIPVTLACDGNRRKEVNMVKKSGGFGWSAAGVSTCRWRGVLVRDLLQACKLGKQPDNERWYLNYEGADDPSEGKYATSIPLAHAMSLENDVMLAYGINGEMLSPDHGAPLRSIIPGYVGGRCVKWLAKLWISKVPNTSHYHIWDNRVVPTWIDSKQTMEAKAFFHHPDTACNEQALQSVICKPAHNEHIPIPSKKDGLKDKIKIEGYAYHGSGHLVQKVEVSLDGGKNWRYCFRRLPDQPLRHGNKFWTWVFWDCEVTLEELLNTNEICVRAWDPMKNTQPEHLTWNLLGMMNNSWYRVRVHVGQDDQGRPSVWFQHPVEPGAGDSGWMKLPPSKQAKEEAAGASASQNEKVISLEEVEKHSSQSDAWIILNNKVYDVTSVLSWHPGGAAAILNYAGKATVQTTIDYNAIHDGYANSQRDKLLIGKLSEDGVKALQEDAKRAAKNQAKLKEERAGMALTPFSYSAATLVNKRNVSADTRIYTFQLPKRDDDSHGVLGLPIGQHVQVAMHMADGVVMRPYTPIRPVLPDEEDGTFDLLVKSYFPNTSSFKPGGTLSNFLDVLEVGEDVDIKGPTGDIQYLGKGRFKVHDDEFHFDKINLIAGGTGLTPHWQLIHAITKDPEDKTQISLIDANSSFDDVLLYDELNTYAKEHGEQFKAWFTLSHKPDGGRDWPYSIGHLDSAMMKEHLYQPEGDSVGTLLCGPPGLIEKAAIPALKEMGFEDGKTMFGY